VSTVLFPSNSMDIDLEWQDFDAKLEAIQAGTAKENPEHPTIQYELLRSDLPPSEKTTSRLNEEAQLLVAAGLTTAAWTMSVTTYCIIQGKPKLWIELPQLRSHLSWLAVTHPSAPSSIMYREGWELYWPVPRFGSAMNYSIVAGCTLVNFIPWYITTSG